MATAAPDPPARTTRVLRFGGHTLDLANRELLCGDERVALGSRYLDALALLADQPGRLVSKDRFMGEVWRGVPVTDEALTQCIRTLRRALGDDLKNPRFIETVPKHGYRFVAAVESAVLDPDAARRAAARSRIRSRRRLAGASAIGGAAAGALGGLAYALAATVQPAASIPVLTAICAAIGGFGGASVGGGMALARLARPGSAGLLIVGAAAGGLIAGALGRGMARDGVALLTGATLGPVTGIVEGLVLGLAVGIATALAPALRRRRRIIGVGALCGGAAGLLIALGGGRMLGASLWELQSGLAASDLALGRIGAALGETGFGPLARALTSTLEGAAFAAGAIAAILFVPRR